jgi:hypothetical protein
MKPTFLTRLVEILRGHRSELPAEAHETRRRITNAQERLRLLEGRRQVITRQHRRWDDP